MFTSWFGDAFGLWEFTKLEGRGKMEALIAQFPRIFEAFFQGTPSTSGQVRGTGLGLSIAQSIIHRHGGLVSCDSSPGNTVFTIYLPMDA